MKQIPQILLVTLMPFALGACNQSSNDPVENIQQAQNDADLQGKLFRGECTLKLLDGIATGLATAGEASIKSAREDYEFKGTNVIHTTRAYNSTDCSGQESIVFRETGIATINEAPSPIAEAKTIDFEMEKVTVQVLDENGKKVAEEIRLCESDNWADQNERDVTAQSSNLTCYGAKVPYKDANIYRLEGNTLIFGSKLGASDTRPNSLNTERQYIAD